MLNVIMLNEVMLSVAAPLFWAVFGDINVGNETFPWQTHWVYIQGQMF